MSLRAYLTLMGFGTVLSAVTFFLVLYRVDPGTSGPLGFALFYMSLFLAAAGAISIVSFAIRAAVRKGEPLFKLVGLSFRQAVLLSGLLVIALALQAHGLLSWWSGALLIAVATAAEFFLISLDRRPAANA